MLPITTSTSDERFSCIKIDDFERPWTYKIRNFIDFLQSLAAAHTSRMNCDDMAVDRLTVCEQKLLGPIGFRASHEHLLKFPVISQLVFGTINFQTNSKSTTSGEQQLIDANKRQRDWSCRCMLRMISIRASYRLSRDTACRTKQQRKPTCCQVIKKFCCTVLYTCSDQKLK